MKKFEQSGSSGIRYQVNEADGIGGLAFVVHDIAIGLDTWYTWQSIRIHARYYIRWHNVTLHTKNIHNIYNITSFQMIQICEGCIFGIAGCQSFDQLVNSPAADPRVHSKHQQVNFEICKLGPIQIGSIARGRSAISAITRSQWFQISWLVSSAAKLAGS